MLKKYFVLYFDPSYDFSGFLFSSRKWSCTIWCKKCEIESAEKWEHLCRQHLSQDPWGTTVLLLMWVDFVSAAFPLASCISNRCCSSQWKRKRKLLKLVWSFFTILKGESLQTGFILRRVLSSACCSLEFQQNWTDWQRLGGKAWRSEYDSVHMPFAAVRFTD